MSNAARRPETERAPIRFLIRDHAPLPGHSRLCSCGDRSDMLYDRESHVAEVILGSTWLADLLAAARADERKRAVGLLVALLDADSRPGPVTPAWWEVPVVYVSDLRDVLAMLAQAVDTDEADHG